MNKSKTFSRSADNIDFRRCQAFVPVTCDLSPQPKVKAGNSVAVTEAMLSSGTINVRQMAEDAAKMQKYIAKGGKQGELSGDKTIRPSGLFNNRVERRK